MVPTVILAVAAVFVALFLLTLRIDGLGLIGPKRTVQIAQVARHYCVDHCRNADGTCPLEAHGVARADCPLFKFVDADMPTMRYGNPFTRLRSTPTHQT